MRVISSSAAKGSSIISTDGSRANARTRPTRCCMPPDSSWGSASANSVNPTSSSRSSTVRSLRSGEARRLRSSSRRALPRTERQGRSAGDCGTKPICLARRASSGGPSADGDRAGRRRLQAGDQAQQRRLPASGRADDGHDLTRFDGQIHRRERIERPERLRESPRLDRCRHSRRAYGIGAATRQALARLSARPRSGGWDWWLRCVALLRPLGLRRGCDAGGLRPTATSTTPPRYAGSAHDWKAHMPDKAATIEKHQTHEGDTGSPEVQIALLTERITHLTESSAGRTRRTTTAGGDC